MAKERIAGKLEGNIALVMGGSSGIGLAIAKQFIRSQLASKAPLNRVGQLEEIAKAAVFLASDDATFVAGIELFADGGTVQV